MKVHNAERSIKKNIFNSHLTLLRLMIASAVFLSLQTLIKSQKETPTCEGQHQDTIVLSPSFTHLPPDYNQKQAQNPNPVLHPISIKLQTGANDQLISREQMQRFRKIFAIVSYFYSKIIFVQKIEPRSQTLFHGEICQNYFDIPEKYSTQGFDTDVTDLVIFLSFYFEGSKCTTVLPCLVQRRPIYGGIIYQYSQFAIYSNQQFQKRVALLTHRFVHILGFNLVFLSWHIESQNLLYAQINTLDTYYFRNSSTTQKLKRSQVMERNPYYASSSGYTMIITPKVKQFIKNTFNCQQDIGASLDNSLTHWNRYTFNNDFMAADYNQKQNDWKYFELTFHFLYDTGFYQYIDLQITDKLHYNWPLVDSCTYLTTPNIYQPQPYIYQTSSFFDRWGIQKISYDEQSLQKYLYSDATLAETLKVQSCTDYFYTKRAIQFESQRNFPYFCLTSECFRDAKDGKQKIRMIINGIIFEGCQDGQTTLQIEFLDLTVKCPLDKQSFCSYKKCPNWCNSQGICSDGKCIAPPLSFFTEIQQRVSSYSVCTDNSIAICPLGCQQCTCQNINQVYCIRTNQGYSKITQSDNPLVIIRIRTCPFGCQDCYNNENTCNDCFENYYWIEGRQSCFKCESSCSACSYTGVKGKIGCINCLEGNYINNFDICESCGIQRCVTCSNSRIKTCQQCIDGYAPNSQNSKCVPCLIGCSKCSQQIFLTCEGCRPGYYLQPNPNNGLYCVSCEVGCQACTSQQCIICYTGWVKDTSKKCVKQCLSPCLTCDPKDIGYCLSCANGYEVNKGMCLPDVSCNNNQSCSDCPQGYSPAQNSKTCIKCQRQNCGQCELGPQYCTKCQMGYYLNFQDGCTVCPKQCKTCFQYDVCNLCSDGYSHPKNIDGSRQKQVCSPCADNCFMCPSSPAECMVCKQGYSKLGWKCVPGRFINYTIAINYPGSVLQFIESGEYELIQNQIKSKFSLGETSDSSLISLSPGSVVMNGQIGNANSQLADQCLLYYQVSKNLSSGSTIRGYNVVRVQIVPGNTTCYQYPFTTIVVETVQTGIPIGIVIAIVVVVLLIMLIITAIFIRRIIKKTQRLVLKYEEFKSKQQYQSTSINQQHKQAF